MNPHPNRYLHLAVVHGPGLPYLCLGTTSCQQGRLALPLHHRDTVVGQRDPATDSAAKLQSGELTPIFIVSMYPTANSSLRGAWGEPLVA